MPRKWEGKWFKNNSGSKRSRVNGRGQPKRGSMAPIGDFPQVSVVFQRADAATPKPQSSQRSTSAAKRQVPQSVRTAPKPQPPTGPVIRTQVKVDDPKPKAAKRGRGHKRRPGYK